MSTNSKTVEDRAYDLARSTNASHSIMSGEYEPPGAVKPNSLISEEQQMQSLEAGSLLGSNSNSIPVLPPLPRPLRLDYTPSKTAKLRPHICATCSRSFARLEHLKRHERSHTKEKPFKCQSCTRSFARRDLLLRHEKRIHSTTPNETRQDRSGSDLYSNGAKRYSSARSAQSSANVSMRNGDDSFFDQEYQRPEFHRSRRGSVASLYEITQEGPSLPPMPPAMPPVSPHHSHLKQLPSPSNRFTGSFYEEVENPPVNGIIDVGAAQFHLRNCYMCREDVSVTRKRDWQRHVLDDLQPYQCFEQDCTLSTQVYNSIRKLQEHYTQEHSSAAVLTAHTWTCLFCEKQFEDDDATIFPVYERFEHVGHHFAEIAFSVVPNQCEDWRFYSDASSPVISALERRTVQSPHMHHDQSVQTPPSSSSSVHSYFFTPLLRVSIDISKDEQWPWRHLFQHTIDHCPKIYPGAQIQSEIGDQQVQPRRYDQACIREYSQAWHLEIREIVDEALRSCSNSKPETLLSLVRRAANENNPVRWLLYGLQILHCDHSAFPLGPWEAGVSLVRRAVEILSSMLHEQPFDRKLLRNTIYATASQMHWGHRLDEDLILTRVLYELAGSLGHITALCKAGKCHECGFGCERDLKKAAKFYRMAAEAGRDMSRMPWIYDPAYAEDDPETALPDNAHTLHHPRTSPGAPKRSYSEAVGEDASEGEDASDSDDNIMLEGNSQSSRKP